MNEPWFDSNLWAWLPGTLLGCLVGLWGSLIGVLVPLRKGRTFVFGFSLLLAGLMTASVIAGLTALATGQPFGVWFFLVMPVLPMNILIIVVLFFLPRFYRMAEARHARAGHLN